MTQLVQSSSDVLHLAERIMARRSRPLVVVSTEPRTGTYAIDTDELARDVADIADLVLIPTGDLIRELDALLPDKTQVYGGAGRSYPVDFHDDPDWRRSPLRFPSPKALQQLVGDVHGQAGSAGLFDRPSARRVAASGVVKGLVADDSRALVVLDGGGLATISRELTHPPIPLGWMLHQGQRVSGTLDLDTGLLLVEEPTPTVAQLVDAFPHGSVTLALVRKVTEARATVQLHPSVEFILRRTDVSLNPLDTVDLLLAEGDVVAARVSHLSDGTLHLRLTDVDDDEPLVPALTLTAGGLPWLEEGRVLELQTTDAATQLAAFDEVRESAIAEPAAPAPHPLPGPGVRHVEEHASETTSAVPETAPAAASGTALQSTQLQLAAERAKVAALERRLAALNADDGSLARLSAIASGAESRLREELAERGDLERQLRVLKEQQRVSTRAVRASRRASAPAAHVESRADRRAKWSTDEEWVRHELYLAWVERVAASERSVWPLGDPVIGPRFASSLDALDDVQFDKAMRAAVDAATGRIREIASREAHPLRTGDGGGDPDTIRASDGAKCWRAYIEQNTAAARRIHYWMLPGRGVELSRIVLHDDVEP